MFSVHNQVFPAASDWTVPQRWEAFTPAEHHRWDWLFARQRAALKDRAVTAFGDGLDLLHLSRPGIPEFGELNERLFARTAWQVVAVPGLVPDDVFFAHLAARRFPAGSFIRGADQLDYLDEPDVFHDVFGHVPLLAHPGYADFMATLGEIGTSLQPGPALDRLARLYWYTVEFGLAREADSLRLYGAGIASSFTESARAIDAAEVDRLPCDLEAVLATRYVSDALQPRYFVLDRFEDVLDIAQREDLVELIEDRR